MIKAHPKLTHECAFANDERFIMAAKGDDFIDSLNSTSEHIRMIRHSFCFALLLVVVTACSDPDFYTNRLQKLLVTQEVSQVKGATDGFHDTFHHYRFLTNQNVIDAFIAREGLTPSENATFQNNLIIQPLLYFNHRVKWWRPEEVAEHLVYVRSWKDSATPSLKLAFDPNTQVTYLIEGYP